jgi:hypothetical protein
MAGSTGQPMPKNLSELETKLDDIFGKKAPQLPENVKEFIVKISPYLAIIGVIFALPAILTVLGIGAVAAPLALMGGVGAFGGFTIGLIFSAIMIVIQIVAIPGLFKRSLSAWRLLFYASLLSAASSLFNLQLGSLIIGTAISFYILFQVRSYYK